MVNGHLTGFGLHRYSLASFLFLTNISSFIGLIKKAFVLECYSIPYWFDPYFKKVAQKARFIYQLKFTLAASASFESFTKVVNQQLPKRFENHEIWSSRSWILYLSAFLSHHSIGPFVIILIPNDSIAAIIISFWIQ